METALIALVWAFVGLLIAVAFAIVVAVGDRGCTLVAIFDYCKTWRCWLRRPTDEERASTPWAQNDA